MIQRIQSIYLFLGVLGLGILFLNSINFGVSSTELSSSAALADGDLDVRDHPALTALSLTGALAFLIAIFLFKNRKLQSNVVKLGLILILALLGFAGFQFGSMQSVAEEASATLSPSLGWIGSGIAFVFGVLSIRSISKDEHLVKSMDRLR